MISHFRSFAKSKWAAGLFALLILSFLVVGAQSDIFASLGPKHVIDAGERSVDQTQFRTEMDRVRNNLQQQASRPVTFEDMAKENIHLRYLESQTQRLGFLDWAWKVGVRPGKELVLKEIRQIPAFFNSITGQFDQQQYQQALAQQNLTPAMLEHEFRDQYATNHFAAGLFAGARTPRIYGALLAGQAMESRDGRWFAVTQAMAGAAPAPTDTQLTAFLNENAAQLRRPEFRTASVVLFSPGGTAAAPIDEKRIQERFEFRKAALSQPETRSFVTLSVPDKAKADAVVAALRGGQDPEAVARANGVQPQTYAGSPQTAVGDAAVGAAIFRLAAGQVSDPIQGQVGFTVAKVASVSPGRPATLESAREALIQELRAEDVKGAVYEKVEQFEKAREQGKPLAAAAEEVGARIVQLPPFTADGRLPDGQQLNAPPQIFTTAYGLAKGGESEVVDAGQGQYFALRLDDVKPAALPTLDEVRAPLAQQWTLRENAKRLAAKAEELAGRIRSGQDIGAVATSAGATVTTSNGVKRDRETQESLGQGLLMGLFGQGRGQTFVQPQSQNTYVVGRVEQIHAATPALAAPLAEQARGQLTQELGNALVERSVAAAATRSGARNNPELARQALGLTTPTPAPAAPTAPGK
ncbi:MAG: rotamase [Brevundimonas sp.]|uniref:peptidylprolyl isomerase n=1 Tax=Brevundimonas sp. TaxID=1871086 RepID=UPI0012253C8D|nr:peptidylprolyl isomerase [Brevundimonas sp.]RZJ18734.1 MAG: rotamase [Brevundimonas sp.]